MTKKDETMLDAPHNAPHNAPHCSTLDRMSAYLAQQDYAGLGEYCEQAIEQEPEEVSNYWYLGLALLLQGNEADAQMAWMTPLLEVDSEEQQAEWMLELAAVVKAEAERQEAKTSFESAWLLRQHLYELIPNDWQNSLHVVELALRAKMFTFEGGLLNSVITSLNEIEPSADNELIHQRLLHITQLLLAHNPEHIETWNFLEACVPHLHQSHLWTKWIELMMAKAAECYASSMNEIAAQLASFCTRLVPNDIKTLFSAINFLQHGGVEHLLTSIPVAERCIALSNHSADRILAFHALLASWIYSGGNWQKATEIYQGYKAEILKFLNHYQTFNEASHTNFLTNQPAISEEFFQGSISGLISIGSLSFYFEDNPQEIRSMRNQIAQIAQTRIQNIFQQETQNYRQQIQHRKMNAVKTRLPKIGYLGGSLRQHSVGWLCRWLMKYHDRSRFEIHLYSTRESDDVIQQDLMQQYGDHFHRISSNVTEIANRICKDEIDILVELDSLTDFTGCAVTATKPAPIQVQWLGCDSAGIPNVDYFIVDPYVLPNDAETYYKESLWRLPHSFIAVDGFEVHTPSLRRDQLGIPNDAVVYLSSQTGMKRNSEHARLQLRLLKEVPNSFFLIKSYLSNPEFVENYFKQLAEEEGVNYEQIRFLPDAPSEYVHRANMGLADVILDTYPYSGATTSLEALWMGLPIVTRVGEQFAARNSYTMMKNVGVTEGIAWSDAEYLEWGVRLGQDAALREDIFYRLRQSRHTSPLWNGQQFAREMEQAYEQMWQRYLG